MHACPEGANGHGKWCVEPRGLQHDYVLVCRPLAIKRSVTAGATRWLNFERAEEKGQMTVRAAAAGPSPKLGGDAREPPRTRPAKRTCVGDRARCAT